MKCKITCEGKTKEVEISEGASFLEAALVNEMNPPYSCLEGACGTCEARLEEGTAEEHSSQVSAPITIRTCVSRPRSYSIINYDKK
jgi:ferredoxin